MSIADYPMHLQMMDRVVPFVVKECRDILRTKYPRTFAAMEKEAASGEPRVRKNFPWKLAELAYLVEKYKPARVLELGSGLTTVLLNEVLPGKVTTIEESEEWAETTRSMTECDIRILPTECHPPGVLGYFGLFEEVIDDEFQMVYVDGPNTGNGPDHPAGGDAYLQLADTCRLAVFDMRTETVEYTTKSLCNDDETYRLEIGIPGSMRLSGDPWFFNGFRYHSLIHLDS